MAGKARVRRSGSTWAPPTRAPRAPTSPSPTPRELIGDAAKNQPRRGCLEICEEGGEVFISHLNMPRPFTAMKKLDMDEVIKDIANKIS